MTTLPENFQIGALNRRLPTLTNIILTLVIAWMAARLTWQLVPAPPRPDIPEHNIPSRQQPTRPRDLDRNIAELHLFGTPGKRVTSKPAPGQSAPATRLKLTLRGLLATDNPDTALAIIQDPKKDERHFSIGDSVFAMATLKAIYPDRVILLHNGRYETLHLPENRIALKTPKPRPVGQRLGKNRERVERMTRLVKEYHKKKLENVRNPWQIIQWEPVMKNGKIAGMKLEAEEEKDFLNRHGLDLGDVVTSINGHELDGGEGLVKALDAVSEAEELVFGIQRGGKEKQVHVHVPQ
ncbi:general secretion pathway protein C [Thiogranum longum]|uniref:General secretion pathway protein C n=1 Tax=Thiogranum longum TaxID=1537524 RepID=A0A4R1HBD8_9GAMM|nr:type II secretion system protein GspC [Thiogranum longum]TCK19284.1 general secretion pathway protein C [Thiogranum longum]